MFTFTSYLDQMITVSRSANINLRDACVKAGLPDSTYYRWMQNKSNPNEASTRKVMITMRDMYDGTP